MKELFLSECRRFKNAALIAALVHLMLQFVANRFIELLQRDWHLHLLLVVVYLACGLAFALVQFSGYRQSSRWIWLMHRPLSPPAIFGATGMAAAALIALAIGLPVLLAILCTDLLTTRVVDLRHYLLAPQLLMLTLTAWLSGAYVILNQRRSAIVILLLPLLMLMHMASGWVMLAPYVLCLALLALIVCGIFKPNRVAPPRHGGAVAATALPLLLGFYFLLIWGGSLGYQYSQMLLGVHPMNSAAPPAGGYTENTRAEGRDVLLRGLAQSADPRAAQWRRQLPQLEVDSFGADVYQFPVRHQVSNIAMAGWYDERQKIGWTFSHDEMRFLGRDLYTGALRGAMGMGGIGDPTRFPSPPLVPKRAKDIYMITPRQLSQYDSATGKLDMRLRVKAPETLAASPVKSGKLLFVITNERLIACAAPQDGASGLFEEKYSIALPGPFSDLDRVDVASLPDGALVSFSFGREMNDGAPHTPQSLMLVDAGGMAQLLARRTLNSDFPLLFEHHDWWVSPALHALLALPNALLDKGMVLDKGHSSDDNALTRPRPPQAWMAAGAAALLAAVLGWLWLRQVPLGQARRLGWISACLLLGPPALPCLLLLQPRPQRPASVPRAAPAPA